MQFYSHEDVQAFASVKFLYIKTSLSGYIFTVTLSRPEKRNAFTPTMAEEIIYALAYAHYNSEIRCVIIDAQGSVFCAGADLNAFHDPSFDRKNDTLPKIKGDLTLGDAFIALSKPAIAKVEGPVLAGGFLMICGVTFVYSTTNATFSLPEVKRGIWPMQVMASLMHIIPNRKVLEMAITGEEYTATEAYELGLVTRISEEGQIGEEVNALAEQICGNAPYAIKSGIAAFHKLKDITERERHTYLKEQLKLLLQTADAKEGALSFKEKRSPNWKGN
ncbi:enoyl-CoA hydratase/isomerase family protein [Dyadobacter arcticus]|uniref:Enoyl-CoA hydratase/carnithine racemase n=1 Tax=Dyadobacter arcticus TaxID=1078754 RepID=A0ABX0UEH6_9BACT|nr:enoyl-CoA hydratase-related protein [Dyadobacter arcticus]NIJ51398.1 enoyl-CoA hydratase/carnithine racemase [Dyadobacter arcticus]